MDPRPRLSVVLPSHNEEANVAAIAKALSDVLSPLGSFELVFVNDASTDGTLAEIKKLAAADRRIRYVSFTRNFGHQAALRDGADVVLVPALDGGYVLVGMRRSAARLFQAISWGSERVMTQTRRRLRQLNLTCVELPALADLDTPADFLRMKRAGWVL